MYENLRKLSRIYDQDFESIFESKLDPIDCFCEEHGIDEQKKLAVEMEMFLQEAEAGTKSEDDLVRMGLEYVPSDDGSWDWFREALAYLKKKIAEG